MGFFSGLAGGLLGSGGSKSSSQSGGFNALPAEITGAYTSFADQVKKMLESGNLTQAYTPADFNAGEKAALSKAYAGVTPTAQSLQADIAMQQNPFDQYVIDAINREAQGQNSILGQNLTQAGQFGSNRQMLGANDIDLTRLQQIGQFKQDQFNNALQNSLGVLTDSRRQDISGALGAGGLERELGLGKSTAGVRSLQEIGKALGVLPTAEGSSSSSNKSSGDTIGNIGRIASGIGSFFSDIRLKQNIIPLGERNGHKLYEFSYTHSPENRFIGVMAQDVEKYMPEAVSEMNGYKVVNYDLVGFPMEAA